MAYEFPVGVVSFKSSGNLSSKQYHVVQPTTCSDNSVKLATAVTDKPLGILQDTPSTGGGDGVAVMVYGVSKAAKDSTGAAITKGDPLVVTTGGGVKTSTAGATNYVLGLALETMAAGTTGWISMLITHYGRDTT